MGEKMLARALIVTSALSVGLLAGCAKEPEKESATTPAAAPESQVATQTPEPTATPDPYFGMVAAKMDLPLERIVSGFLLKFGGVFPPDYNASNFNLVISYQLGTPFNGLFGFSKRTPLTDKIYVFPKQGDETNTNVASLQELTASVPHCAIIFNVDYRNVSSLAVTDQMIRFERVRHDAENAPVSGQVGTYRATSSDGKLTVYCMDRTTITVEKFRTSMGPAVAQMYVQPQDQ
jgi:hypothetical protein